MSTMTDYTQDEIDKLMAAPMLVSMYVMGSSLSGPVGLVREMMAGVQTAIDAGKQAAPDSLFYTLWSEENMKIQQDKVKQETKASTEGAQNMDEAKGKMLGDIKTSLTIISAKGSPEEVDTFKRLIGDVARNVADAAKEGGFMGIGGVQVNEAERQAMRDIHDAMGMMGEQVTSPDNMASAAPQTAPGAEPTQA
jgi:hypothetical protein